MSSYFKKIIASKFRNMLNITDLKHEQVLR